MTSLKPRLSSFELLRLLSMFGVLIVHANFGALGWPSQAELLSTPNYTILRIFIEAFAIVAVNVFVLISGWFGINFRLGSLFKLLFQCIFFFFGIYFIGHICNLTQISLFKGVYMCLMMSENAWFIKCYIGMYIFAPVMNAFIANSSEKQIKIFLFLFFIFQSIYGWISNGAAFIKDGYSTFSFMGLYLLARYVATYKPSWSKWNIYKDFIIYIILSIITAIGILIFLYLDSFYHIIIFLKYCSILIIGAALFLLLAFSKLSFYNKFINWIATSCLAVYLFHFILFSQIIKPWIQSIATRYNGLTMILLIFMLLLAFYITAILIDKIRLYIWDRITTKLILLKTSYDTNKK